MSKRARGQELEWPGNEKTIGFSLSEASINS